ncbi:MAG TPA: GNAT family N-acetyltransferase [Streptosporangiaceae bacterium]|nr:GNAT family N-acetyltransferase [Streptosporangiaceae bacterium]
MQRKSQYLASPFLSPEFAVAVGMFRSSARVAVLADGPQLAGFFPFEKRKLGVGVPIGAGLTDFQGLVHAPGADWEPRQLLRACGISVWQFDHLLSGQRPFEPYQSTLVPSPVMDLSGGFDVYREKLRVRSHSFYRTMAYKARKLGRDRGEVRFVLDAPDTVALRRLMAWKSDQYRRTGRIDRFSQPWVVDLVDYLLNVRGGGFSSVLSFLYAGDEPVAGHLGLRFDRVLTGWFPAYDKNFHSYSPGLLHHLRLAESAAEAGIHRIDMGKGAKDYKETLKSWDLFVAEGTVAGRSPLAGAHRSRSTFAHWAFREIRNRPKLFAAADRILCTYGRARSSLRSAPRPSRPAARDEQRHGSQAGRT